MSKSSQQNRNKRKKHTAPPKKPPATISDRSLYLGFMLIGVFVVGIISVASDGHWREPLLGYCIVMCGLAIGYAVMACNGAHLAPWRQALAKLVLRWAGYGTKGGKPLDAAHNAPGAKKAVGVGVIASLVLLAGLSILLYPKLFLG